VSVEKVVHVYESEERCQDGALLESFREGALAAEGSSPRDAFLSLRKPRTHLMMHVGIPFLASLTRRAFFQTRRKLWRSPRGEGRCVEVAFSVESRH